MSWIGLSILSFGICRLLLNAVVKVKAFDKLE